MFIEHPEQRRSFLVYQDEDDTYYLNSYWRDPDAQLTMRTTIASGIPTQELAEQICHTWESYEAARWKAHTAYVDAQQATGIYKH